MLTNRKYYSWHFTTTNHIKPLYSLWTLISLNVFMLWLIHNLSNYMNLEYGLEDLPVYLWLHHFYNSWHWITLKLCRRKLTDISTLFVMKNLFKSSTMSTPFLMSLTKCFLQYTYTIINAYLSTPQAETLGSTGIIKAKYKMTLIEKN